MLSHNLCNGKEEQRGKKQRQLPLTLKVDGHGQELAVLVICGNVSTFLPGRIYVQKVQISVLGIVIKNALYLLIRNHFVTYTAMTI